MRHIVQEDGSSDRIITELGRKRQKAEQRDHGTPEKKLFIKEMKL